MNVKDAIQQRRSIKSYDPAYKMSEAEVNELLSLAILSPTAFNIQHWRLVNVTDPAIRQQIREVAWDQAQVTDASMLLVLCADTKAWAKDTWAKDTKRYWENSPSEFQDFIIPAIQGYYEGRESVQRDEALRSSGIIAQTLMLAAKSMDLDTCPMDGFDFDAVAKIINLPEDHLIAHFVVVGKAAEEAKPRGGQLPLSEVVFENTFS